MNERPQTRRRNTDRAVKQTVGKLGASQAVSTFGVGSLYEMRSVGAKGGMIVHSVMLSGLEFWPSDNAGYFYESSLQRALGVGYFRRPPVDPGLHGGGVKPLPAIRFPKAHYCSSRECSRVGVVGHHFTDKEKSGVVCAKQGCKGKGIPFRFVVACYLKGDLQHPGHIEDFPYAWWAHSRAESCDASAIQLLSSSTRSGLEGLVLFCENCGASRSLAGVFAEDALDPLKCRGKRPWLEDSQEDCQRHLRVMQRGASNVYFAITASAISIPPHSSRLRQILEDSIPPAFLRSVQDGVPGAVENLLQNMRNVPGLDDRERYSDCQITDAIVAMSGVEESEGMQTLVEQKRLEQNAIVMGCADPEDDFEAQPVDLNRSWCSKFLRHLVQVHRLREVRATRGFQRVEPSYGGDPYRVECAPLSASKQGWLPAIEVRGEGIYVGLCPDEIARWEERSNVRGRIGLLNSNYRGACAAAGVEPYGEISARFVLAHTLSHLLMKQLSLECGYSGSSLRERLYVDSDGPERTGLLIYTASGSADGTLGGLVSQGTIKNFPDILKAALRSSQWCSSDPLCEESQGQGTDAMNLAACHACALVAETSCEERNRMLDRAFLVGTTVDPELGYFGDVLKSWNCP